MIDLNAFSDEIKSKGSWAIWDKENVKDIHPIIEQQSSLHSNVVFVGLNKSKRVSHWGNFHLSGFDNRLQKGIDSLRPEIRTIVTGAYMTDLVVVNEDEETADAFRILDKFKDTTFIRNQKNFLLKELALIGATEDTIFILLGKNAGQYFPLFTDGKFEKLVPTIHHSNRFGKNEDWQAQWKSEVEQGFKKFGINLINR